MKKKMLMLLWKLHEMNHRLLIASSPILGQRREIKEKKKRVKWKTEREKKR
jgi:hypothetical protein